MGYESIVKNGQNKTKGFRVIFEFAFSEEDEREMSKSYFEDSTDFLEKAQDEAEDIFGQKPTFERIDKNPAPAFFSYPFDNLNGIKNIIEEYGSGGVIELSSGVKMQNFEAARYHPANYNPYYPLSEWDSKLGASARLQMTHLSRAIAQLKEYTSPTVTESPNYPAEPTGLTGKKLYEALRAIVENNKPSVINDYSVSVSDAEAVIERVDSTKPYFRKKYLNLPIAALVTIAVDHISVMF